MRRRRAIGIMAIGAFAGSVLFATSPIAADAASTDSPNLVIQTPMHMVGYDSEIAAQNGYEIRTLPDGSQYSVPVGTADKYVPPADELVAPRAVQETGEASPNVVVVGDCGDSWVEVNNYSFNTGYAVDHSVSFSKWGVQVKSELYLNQDFNLDHGATSPYWTFTADISPAHCGDGFARVNTGSFVVMINGGVCYSGNPLQTWYFT